MNKQKLFKILLIISFFALVVGITQKSNAGLIYIGAMAEDGTRMLFTYFDPFAQYMDEDGNFKYNGTDQFIIENTVIEFQEISVYISVNASKTIDYNITYYNMYLNQTLTEQYGQKVYDYEKYDYERRIVECSIYDFFTIDEFELEVHLDMVYIEITYLDLRFGFYHKTFEAALPPDIETLWDARLEAIKTAFTVFGVVVVIGGLTAYALISKAGNFDLHWSYAVLIPVVIVNVFMIYATYFHYFSLKEMVYRFPYWAIIFIMYCTSTLILINLFNAIKGRKAIRCDKFDTKSMTVETHIIPVDQDEAKYMEFGIKASCIRLFSGKRYDNSLNFGKFDEEPSDHYAVVSDNEEVINKKVEQMEKKDYIYKGIMPAELGSVKLHFIKIKLVFKQSELVPRWFWTPKNRAGFLKGYLVKHIVTRDATIEIKSLWWLPSGGFCLFNLIFGFVYQNKSETLDNALKVSLWIVFGIILLVTVGYHSIPGKFEIEVLEPHIAIAIIKASEHLQKSEKDAKDIKVLQERIYELEGKFNVDILKAAEKIATPWLRGLRSQYEYKLQQDIKRSEKKDEQDDKS